MFGTHSYRVGTEKDILAGLDTGLGRDGPAIINVADDHSHRAGIGAQLHSDVFE